MLRLSFLTKNERRARTLWMIFFTINQLLVGVSILIHSSENAPPNFDATDGCGYTLWLIASCFFFHCAYRKAGIRWLFAYLCIKPFFILFEIVSSFSAFEFRMTPFVGFIIFSITYYLLSWKLRKINLKLQRLAADPTTDPEIYPDGYNAEVQTLFADSTQSALDHTYASLVRKWPQFEQRTTRIYKVALDSLENPHSEETHVPLNQS